MVYYSDNFNFTEKLTSSADSSNSSRLYSPDSAARDSYLPAQPTDNTAVKINNIMLLVIFTLMPKLTSIGRLCCLIAMLIRPSNSFSLIKNNTSAKAQNKAVHLLFAWLTASARTAGENMYENFTTSRKYGLNNSFQKSGAVS